MSFDGMSIGKAKSVAPSNSPLREHPSHFPSAPFFQRSAEAAPDRSDAIRAIIAPAFLTTRISSRRVTDAYMAADAQGDQQIRPVVSVAMMDHQCRTLATSTAAEAVPLQHALAQSAEKAYRMMSRS
jgi:hypothetical protein